MLRQQCCDVDDVVSIDAKKLSQNERKSSNHAVKEVACY